MTTLCVAATALGCQNKSASSAVAIGLSLSSSVCSTQFPMGAGGDGPLGGMAGMEPHHMNGSLGENKYLNYKYHACSLSKWDCGASFCLLVYLRSHFQTDCSFTAVKERIASLNNLICSAFQKVVH